MKAIKTTSKKVMFFPRDMTTVKTMLQKKKKAVKFPNYETHSRL